MLRRDEMRDGVLGIVQHHFGVARRAGREVHEHRVGRRRLTALEVLGRGAHARVEVEPAGALDARRAHAFRPRQRLAQRQAVVGEHEVAVGVLGREAAARAVHEDAALKRGARVGHAVAHLGDVAERCGDDGLDGRAVQAVFQVVFLEHEGGGNHDGAQLRQRGGHEPELVVAPQDDHDHVAAADALLGQEVRGLVRPALHIGEREHVVLALGVAPHHGAAVGVVHGDVVDHVVAEVEACRTAHLERGKHAVLVVGLVHVAEVDVSHNGVFLGRSMQRKDPPRDGWDHRMRGAYAGGLFGFSPSARGAAPR